MDDRREVEAPRLRALGEDHERPVEPAGDVVRGDLVRVVPERAGLVRAKSVRVALARHDGVLGHAGDAVFRVRHVDPVPVDRDAVLDILVAKGDLDEVAAVHPQLRARQAAVEGESVDGLP